MIKVMLATLAAFLVSLAASAQSSGSMSLPGGASADVSVFTCCSASSPSLIQISAYGIQHPDGSYQAINWTFTGHTIAPGLVQYIFNDGQNYWTAIFTTLGERVYEDAGEVDGFGLSAVWDGIGNLESDFSRYLREQFQGY